MPNVRTTFAIAFALFIGITLIVPSFPPAQLLYKYLGMPQITSSFSGISVTTLLYGIMNGCFWTIITVAAYALVQSTRATRLAHAHTKEPVPAELDIETIKGIGPVRGTSLRNSGIDTVSDLLRAGATKDGRHRLASDVGVKSTTMLKWVYRGDSLRMENIKRMRRDEHDKMVKHDNEHAQSTH